MQYWHHRMTRFVLQTFGFALPWSSQSSLFELQDDTSPKTASMFQLLHHLNWDKGGGWSWLYSSSLLLLLFVASWCLRNMCEWFFFMSRFVRVWDGMNLICEALTSSAPRGREICENPTTTCDNQGKQLTLSYQFSIFCVSWIGYSPWALVLRSKTFMTASRVSSSSIYVFSLWIWENLSKAVEFARTCCVRQLPWKRLPSRFFDKYSERWIIFQSNACPASAWDEQ